MNPLLSREPLVTRESVQDALLKEKFAGLSRDDVFRKMRSLQVERRQEERRHQQVRAYLAALERLIAIYDDKSEFSSDASVLVSTLRKAIKKAEPTGPGEGSARTRFLAAQWFDVRGLGAGDQDMAEFGAELIAEGVIRLPFEDTVFVTRLVSDKNSATVAELFEQREKAIGIVARLAVPDQGRPVLWVTQEQDTPHNQRNQIFYTLAALSSQATEVQRRTFRDASVARPDAPAGDAYHAVTVKTTRHDAPLTGTHASPRLHWRRGHIRRLAPERTTWVRPTLVGYEDRGTIIHDYVA